MGEKINKIDYIYLVILGKQMNLFLLQIFFNLGKIVNGFFSCEKKGFRMGLMGEVEVKGSLIVLFKKLCKCLGIVGSLQGMVRGGGLVIRI